MKSSNQSRAWLLAGASVVLVSIVVRWAMNFRFALAPAMDGAYYPMQTLWLIKHGRLMYDDLPLMFWLNTAVTRVLVALGGMPLDEAAMLASRALDVVLQPWAAVFVLLLGYRWAGGHRVALLGCTAAAVLAVLSPPIMRMASDFQKNSLGLVWMVLALWVMREAMARPGQVWRWMLLSAVISLAAITHVGAFGVTCIMLGSAGVAYGLMGGGIQITRRRVVLTAVISGAACLLFAMMGWFEPTRTSALLNAPWRVISVQRVRLPGVVLMLVMYGLLALVLRQLWRDRSRVARCDRAILIGTAVAAAVLFFPFIEGDYAQRFLLMSPMPLAILLAFVMSRRAVEGKPLWPAKALAVAASVFAIAGLFMMQGPLITVEQADELKAFREDVADPSRTLVVAPHGIQYWAGLFMHTPVRMGVVPDDAFTRYSRVLIIQPTAKSLQARRPPVPGRGNNHVEAMHKGAGQGRRELMRREIILPQDAVLIRNGEYFQIYEIPVPTN